MMDSRKVKSEQTIDPRAIERMLRAWEFMQAQLIQWLEDFLVRMEPYMPIIEERNRGRR